jgi:hypothetical protein
MGREQSPLRHVGRFDPDEGDVEWTATENALRAQGKGVLRKDDEQLAGRRSGIASEPVKAFRGGRIQGVVKRVGF